MFRVILGIVVFLIVVATPAQAGAPVYETASFDPIAGAVMALPALAFIALHHIRHRPNSFAEISQSRRGKSPSKRLIPHRGGKDRTLPHLRRPTRARY